jgi:menaquinone-dependent protoporphyrinogen oxidase
MRVLVTAASRHGSTIEVAEQIARVLSAAGLRVDVRSPAEVEDLAPYGAIVIGSAIYYGGWLPDALGLVRRHEEALLHAPVWLFSVGALVAENPAPATSAPVAELVRRTRARGHRAFRGALAVERLSLRERLMVALVRAPYGDFRNWTDVREWAGDIAAHLASGERTPPPASGALQASPPQ